jgi:hypothetical protein
MVPQLQQRRNNPMKKSTLMRCLTLSIAAAMVAGAALASGPHKAKLSTRNGTMSGDVSWLPASKAYKITSRSVTRQIELRDVTGVRLLKQPAGLSSAIASGNITQLTRIMKDYEGFGPDKAAAQGLIKAYVRNNQAPKAVRECELLFRKNPDMMKSADLQMAYWEALRQSDLTAKLRLALVKALQTGDRPLQAAACLQRGHLERTAGDMRKALVDGYLRCTVLYQNVAAVQPEALYWAYKCHQTLNENNYAERWRTKLTGKYGRSEWAKKVQGSK